MPRITRRPLAAADIFEIWDYIADDSLIAADRWVDRLDEQFDLLATQPLMGRARDELAPGVRSFPFGRYVIFYASRVKGLECRKVAAAAERSPVQRAPGANWTIGEIEARTGRPCLRQASSDFRTSGYRRSVTGVRPRRPQASDWRVGLTAASTSMSQFFSGPGRASVALEAGRLDHRRPARCLGPNHLLGVRTAGAEHAEASFFKLLLHLWVTYRGNDLSIQRLDDRRRGPGRDEEGEPGREVDLWQA
jgi:toxin ParE1/3/4